MGKKPFGKTKVGGLLKGLFKNAIQTLPVVGTLVTAMDDNVPDSPPGKLRKLTPWHIYRILIGLVIGFVIYKGWLSEGSIEWIWQFVQNF